MEKLELGDWKGGLTPPEEKHRQNQEGSGSKAWRIRWSLRYFSWKGGQEREGRKEALGTGRDPG